ncbi:hypothetical protein BDN70DRAFT_899964 [Pholiota conissans]|uniref:Uncharacterized protein n=1 Tax=Pholiota conissans TaxID=109636 RepID=A0A9P5YQE7_9AGAR|nr:hypothetical protein BDN70DRAFT_899964 [Pholiota conissans]
MHVSLCNNFYPLIGRNTKWMSSDERVAYRMKHNIPSTIDEWIANEEVHTNAPTANPHRRGPSGYYPLWQDAVECTLNVICKEGVVKGDVQNEYTLMLRLRVPPTTSFLMYYWRSPTVVIDQYTGDPDAKNSPEWLKTVETVCQFWQRYQERLNPGVMPCRFRIKRLAPITLQTLPSPLMPGQAGPASGPGRAFGPAWEISKPEPPAQAPAFEWLKRSSNSNLTDSHDWYDGKQLVRRANATMRDDSDTQQCTLPSTFVHSLLFHPCFHILAIPIPYHTPKPSTCTTRHAIAFSAAWRCENGVVCAFSKNSTKPGAQAQAGPKLGLSSQARARTTKLNLEALECGCWLHIGFLKKAGAKKSGHPSTSVYSSVRAPSKRLKDILKSKGLQYLERVILYIKELVIQELDINKQGHLQRKVIATILEKIKRKYPSTFGVDAPDHGERIRVVNQYILYIHNCERQKHRVQEKKKATAKLSKFQENSRAQAPKRNSKGQNVHSYSSDAARFDAASTHHVASHARPMDSTAETPSSCGKLSSMRSESSTMAPDRPPQAQNSSSQSGAATQHPVYAFLDGCLPSMAHHFQSMVDFGCSTPEFLLSMSEWDPMKIRKDFLGRLPLNKGVGDRLTEMEKLVIQHTFRQRVDIVQGIYYKLDSFFPLAHECRKTKLVHCTLAGCMKTPADFVPALSRFIAQYQHPTQTKAYYIDRVVANLHIPFSSIPVFHRLKFWSSDVYAADPLARVIVNPLYVEPARLDKYRLVVPSRFDIGLVNFKEGGPAGVKGYCAARIRAFGMST